LRPPYGDIDDRVRAVVEAARYRILHWNLDSFDWQIAEYANIITQNLYEKLSSGANYTNELSEVKHRTEKGFIVLAHDARSDVVNGWIAALESLVKTDYRLEPVSKCLQDEPYSEESPTETEESPTETPDEESEDESLATSPRMVLEILHFSL
jgi:hypothetical protein